MEAWCPKVEGKETTYAKAHRGEDAPPTQRKEDVVYGRSPELETGGEKEATETSRPQRGA